jgi:hypothetical protein
MEEFYYEKNKDFLINSFQDNETSKAPEDFVKNSNQDNKQKSYHHSRAL